MLPMQNGSPDYLLELGVHLVRNNSGWPEMAPTYDGLEVGISIREEVSRLGVSSQPCVVGCLRCFHFLRGAQQDVTLEEGETADR